MYNVRKVKYGWAIFLDDERIDTHASRDREEREAVAVVLNWATS